MGRRRNRRCPFAGALHVGGTNPRRLPGWRSDGGQHRAGIARPMFRTAPNALSTRGRWDGREGWERGWTRLRAQPWAPARPRDRRPGTSNPRKGGAGVAAGTVAGAAGALVRRAPRPRRPRRRRWRRPCRPGPADGRRGAARRRGPPASSAACRPPPSNCWSPGDR